MHLLATGDAYCINSKSMYLCAFVSSSFIPWSTRLVFIFNFVDTGSAFVRLVHYSLIGEEQERQLSNLHWRDLVSSKHFAFQRKKSPSLPAGNKESSRTSSQPEGVQQQSGGGASTKPKPFKGICHKCLGFGHKMRDCPQRDPPSETPAHVSTSMVTANRPASDQAIGPNHMTLLEKQHFTFSMVVMVDCQAEVTICHLGRRLQAWVNCGSHRSMETSQTQKQKSTGL